MADNQKYQFLDDLRAVRRGREERDRGRKLVPRLPFPEIIDGRRHHGCYSEATSMQRGRP